MAMACRQHRRNGLIPQRPIKPTIVGLRHTRRFLLRLWSRKETNQTISCLRTRHGNRDPRPNRCWLPDSRFDILERNLYLEYRWTSSTWRPDHHRPIASLRCIFETRSVGHHGDASICWPFDPICHRRIYRSRTYRPVANRRLLLRLDRPEYLQP